jgi:exonuclease VII small subunit
MELWQRGELLANRCQELLEAARSTVAHATEANPASAASAPSAGSPPTP